MRLAKYEPIAFVAMFAAFGYAFVEMIPRSSLREIFRMETSAGYTAAIVAVALLVLRLLPRRRLGVERLIYALFLAAMPFVYLVPALMQRHGQTIAIESVGVLVFVGLAVYGYFKSFALLGIGIVLHGIGWDLWHHQSATYMASWYPLACLFADLLMGFLAMTQSHAHQSSDDTTQM